MTRFLLYLILAGISAVAAAYTVSIAQAAGGQNQWNNPIFANGCVAQLPAGIDLDICEAVSGAGLITYYCRGETITVTCPDDGPQAPGQNKAYLFSA